jgi:hypothetical protein
MIINSGKYTRSIYSQSAFAFVLDAAFPNSSLEKYSTFGVSGSGGYLELFKFSGGKVLDHNNRFVWHYNPNQSINISGNIAVDNLNYYINNNPICIYSPKVDQGVYNFALFDTNHDEIDFDLAIYGESPVYSFSFPTTVNSDQNITGYMLNSVGDTRKSFQIFSGDSVSSNYEYTLTGWQTSRISGLSSGAFTFKVDQIFLPSPIDNRITFTLNTNFGDVTGAFDFNINPVPVYYTDFITGLTGVFNDKAPFSSQYIFDLRSIWPINRDFTFSLSYVSGNTGIISGSLPASGAASGIFSGFVDGYDYVSGLVTGSGVYTGIDGTVKTGDFIPLVGISRQYATGPIGYNYSLPAYNSGAYIYSPPNSFVTPFSGIGAVITPLENKASFVLGGQEALVSGIANITGSYRGLDNVAYGATGFAAGMQYFTGDFLIDYTTNLWSANFFTGTNFIGKSDDLFISGFGFDIATPTPDSDGVSYMFEGKIVDDVRLLSTYRSAKKLESLIAQKSGFIAGLSGTVISSTGVLNPRTAFFNGEYCPVYTDTGFIEYQFTNYSSTDLKNVTHYGFNVDLFSQKFPSNFTFEVFNTTTSTWQAVDVETGISFYPTGSRWFALDSPIVLPARCRLRIVSGSSWPHFSNATPSSIESLRKETTYGIKCLDLYSSIDVFRINTNGDINYNLDFVDTGISNYEVRDIPSDKQEYLSSGIVVYSADDVLNPAWYCFNSNKTLYRKSSIYGNGKYQEFVGFSGVSVATDGFNSFRIEFDSVSGTPFHLAIYEIPEQSGSDLNLVYEKYRPSIIESGRLETSRGIKGLVYSFNQIPLNIFDTGFADVVLDFVYKDSEIDRNVNFYKEQEIFPSGRSYGVENSYFGYTFEINSNGDILAVSSLDQAIKGGVYIYKENLAGYAFQQFITGASTNLGFGSSISLNQNGSLLAVAEPAGAAGKGAVYVYQANSLKNNWALIQSIEGINNIQGFGRYVKLSEDGSILAVSSKDSQTNLDGSVWIYRKLPGQSTWQVVSTFSGQPFTSANLGASIEISQNNSLIFVGAPEDVPDSYVSSNWSSSSVSSLERLVSPGLPIVTQTTRSGFNVFWNQSQGANSYRVDVSTDVGFSSFVTNYNNRIINNNQIDVTGLNTGTNYFIRVKSLSGVFSSPFSPIQIQTTAPYAYVQMEQNGSVEGSDFTLQGYIMINTGSGEFRAIGATGYYQRLLYASNNSWESFSNDLKIYYSGGISSSAPNGSWGSPSATLTFSTPNTSSRRFSTDSTGPSNLFARSAKLIQINDIRSGNNSQFVYANQLNKGNFLGPAIKDYDSVPFREDVQFYGLEPEDTISLYRNFTGNSRTSLFTQAWGWDGSFFTPGGYNIAGIVDTINRRFSGSLLGSSSSSSSAEPRVLSFWIGGY